MNLETRNKEIKRLESILSHPRQVLYDAGFNEESLRAVRQKLLNIQKYVLDVEGYNRNNKIYLFSPNPPQLDFWIAYLNPKYRTFCYTGANKRGKTTIGCHLAIATMLGYIPYKLESVDMDGKVHRSWESVYREIKEWEGVTWNLKWRDGVPLVELIFQSNEPRKIRYVGQGWKVHVRDVVVPALRKWWPKDHAVRTRKNGDGIEDQWWSEDGSYLNLMSNDQDPEKFAGKDDDLVIMDEPMKKDNYVELRRGTVVQRGKLFLGATLLAKEIWIDREIIKAKNKDGTPDTRIYRSDGYMTDNLGFGIRSQQDIDDYGDELLRIKPEEYAARIEGKPSYLAGLIYASFSVDTHVVKRFDVPLDWIVEISIDPHPKEPHAVSFLATTPKGLKYVVDEIWMHGDPKSLAEMIIKKIRDNHYRIETNWIIDPYSKGDSNNPESTFDKIENTILPYGYYLDVAEKGKDCVNDGIITVKDWLMTQNRQPALYFFDNCIQTIYEIEGWMWNPKTRKPVDENDHFMENLRRLITLGTKWFPMQPPTIEVGGQEKGTNEITAY
jgi:hypothetical protein